ncbi:MAG: OmpH family outer membrane protein [Planctomycetes bacterium]|nr:OmpH family outer membrane protein [Planctomycetota bacterium]
MKNHFLSESVACLVLAPALVLGLVNEIRAEKAQKSPSNLAVADLDRVYRSHPKYAANQKAIHDLLQRRTGELAELEASAIDIRFKIENALNMGDGARAQNLAKAFRAADEKAKQFWPQAQKEIDKLTNERKQEIMDEIQKAVSEFAAKRQIHVVFSRSAISKTTVFADGLPDITSDIIFAIRKK